MSAGMNFSGIRSARFPGLALALLLMSACALTDGTDRNITAEVGESATLPCDCPAAPPAHLVWQRGEQLVNFRRAETDTEEVAAEYLNRTQLEPTRGCALLILSVRQSDQGLYKCFYQKSPVQHHNIYLEVRERQSMQGERQDTATVVSSSVCAVVIVALIAVVYVGLKHTRRNTHRTNGAFVATPTGV